MKALSHRFVRLGVVSIWLLLLSLTLALENQADASSVSVPPPRKKNQPGSASVKFFTGIEGPPKKKHIGHQQEQENTCIGLISQMIKLCVMMVLVSYLPSTSGLLSEIPDLYKETPEKRAEYGKLMRFIDHYEGRELHVDDLQEIMFKSPPLSDKIRDYMKALGEKGENFQKELAQQEQVLEIMGKEYGDDGSLLYLRPHADDVTGIFGIVANYRDNRLVLVFRGSQNARDWMTNFRVRMKKYTFHPEDDKNYKRETDIGIHRGFANRLEGIVLDDEDSELLSLYDLIKKKLLASVHNKFPPDNAHDKSKCGLYVTGHSLGGALATIAGYLLAQDPDIQAAFDGPVTTVSFAAPRVGNHGFRRVHQHLETTGRLRHLRVMNDDDYVPTIPKHNVGLDAYTHVGLRWLINPDKKERKKTQEKSYKADLAYPDVTKRNAPIDPFGLVKNHFTWVYNDRIKNLLERSMKDCSFSPHALITPDQLFDTYLQNVKDPLITAKFDMQ